MLNNINVKISRGGYKMKKHKYIFFLTILLFIIIYTILIPAHVSAQGSFFDALCVAIANNVNELVIGQEVDQETKQIQISAVKVFLRGDESDWDEFVDSTKNWAESSLETETKKPSFSPSKPGMPEKFVQNVESTRKEIGKTYYFEGKIGNSYFTMEVPPYMGSDCNILQDRYFNREAKVYGIYPINQPTNQAKDVNQKIKTFFDSLLGGERKFSHLVILEVVDADNKRRWPSAMDHASAMSGYGLFAVLINEKTKYLNVFDDAVHLFYSSSIGGWERPIPELNKTLKDIGVKWNIPNIFVYDLDHDGYDEITLLIRGDGSQGVFDFNLEVFSTEQSLMKSVIYLREVVLYVMRPKISDGELTIKYKNIHFDGNNLYVDGKNIMSYQ